MNRDSLRRDWTKGSVAGSLWSLSWPMMVQQGLFIVGQTIDMIWIGRLGVTAIAGVGVAFIIITLMLMVQQGLVIGARAMVARFVGAGDAESANHVAGQAFVISAVYSVLITVIGVFLAEPILGLFGLEADVIVEGATYLRITFAGWLTLSFWMVSFTIMQASGDTVMPMKITVFFRLLQVAFCPFLVLGWWIFPPLGVSGAALSVVIAQSLGMVIGFWVLFSGRTRLQLTLRNFRLDLNIIWRQVKISIPASIMNMQRAFGNLLLTWFMAHFGTLAVGGHGLAQRVEMLLTMPIQSMGTGAGVLVGQNLGAKQPERAERSGWLAAGFAEAFMVICAVVTLVWAENIASIFTSEPNLVEITSTFLRIAAVGYLVQGLNGILQNCISGAGDTLPPMVISLVVVWVLQLPLAFLLSRVTGLGMYGVRWAIVAGVVVGAVVYITYFRWGRWKRKKV